MGLKKWGTSRLNDHASRLAIKRASHAKTGSRYVLKMAGNGQRHGRGTWRTKQEIQCKEKHTLTTRGPQSYWIWQCFYVTHKRIICEKQKNTYYLVASMFISSLFSFFFLLVLLVIVFVFIIHLASWDNENPSPFPTTAFRFARKINCEMNILADRHSTCDKSSTCHVLDVKVITSHCCTHGTWRIYTHLSHCQRSGMFIDKHAAEGNYGTITWHVITLVCLFVDIWE